jgi:hypothetical protein
MGVYTADVRWAAMKTWLHDNNQCEREKVSVVFFGGSGVDMDQVNWLTAIASSTRCKSRSTWPQGRVVCEACRIRPKNNVRSLMQRHPSPG